MEADIHTFYSSGFYCLRDFRCRCKDCNTSRPEYSKNFCISFIRKGNFLFNVFRNSFDAHTGRMLVTKPGFEHTVTHTNHAPDECTIIDFKDEFYDHLMNFYGRQRMGFFQNNDIHSTILSTSVETEYIHHMLLIRCFQSRQEKLEMDGLVMELVHHVMKRISGISATEKLGDTLKANHLITIERAKAFLAAHFTDDISLQDLATHCFVSAFHFSRIFKEFTSYSPHQYLLNLRLQHAAFLLKNSALPVSDICFSSGFNSLEYFSSAFRQKYQSPPSRFRVNQALPY